MIKKIVKLFKVIYNNYSRIKIIIIIISVLLVLTGVISTPEDTAEKVDNYVPLLSIDGVEKKKHGVIFRVLLRSTYCKYSDDSGLKHTFPCKVIEYISLRSLGAEEIRGTLGINKEPDHCQQGCTIIITQDIHEESSKLLLEVKDVVPPVNVLTSDNDWNKIEVTLSDGSIKVFEYRNKVYLPVK